MLTSITALTTATAFGSLIFSSHPGASSMGKLLALSLVCTLAAAAPFQPHPDGQAARRAIRNLIVPNHEKENSAMLSKLLLSAAFIAVSSSAFAASGTPLEQAACRHDVRKFCHTLKEAAGDEAYTQCLQAHRDQLSVACKKVLTDNGM